MPFRMMDWVILGFAKHSSRHGKNDFATMREIIAPLSEQSASPGYSKT
jgi:hypothetical protein